MRWVVLGVAVLSACHELAPPPDAGLPENCLSATPAMVDFGEVETGRIASNFVRITNLLNRSVPLTAVPLQEPFRCELITSELRPRGEIFLGLLFRPIDGKLHFGSFALEAADGCRIEVPVRGLGTGAVTHSTDELDFGMVDPGESRALELTLANSKRIAVRFDVALEPVLGASSPFRLDFTSPLTLPPGSVVTLSVTASPSTYERSEAVISFRAGGELRTVRLRVIGGAPRARISPATIDIPTMDFTADSQPPSFVDRPIFIGNDAPPASLPLEFVPPVFEARLEDGGLTEELSLRGPFGPLAGGEGLEANLHVQPSREGRHRYQLVFFTNDPKEAEAQGRLERERDLAPAVHAATPFSRRFRAGH